jgi:hypothetical protein
MFSQISMNWWGKLLISHEDIINFIGSTTTPRSGLTVMAELDTTFYEKGIRINGEELTTVNQKKAAFRDEWNYSIENNCPW